MLMAAPDAESDLVDAEGEVKATDGDTSQALRDSLKRTVIQQDGTSASQCPKIQFQIPGKYASMYHSLNCCCPLFPSLKQDVTLRDRRRSLSQTEPLTVQDSEYAPRQYFILTHAGKPVFMT